jgi:hypothetical protein
MIKDDKFLVELLYKELEHAREKARKTDEWVFKTISIIIIPFFILPEKSAKNIV